MRRRSFLATAPLFAVPAAAPTGAMSRDGAPSAGQTRPALARIPLLDGGLADTTASSSETVLITPMGEDNIQYLGDAPPGTFKRIMAASRIGVLFGFSNYGDGPTLRGDAAATAAGNGVYALTPDDVLEVVALDEVNKAGRRVWQQVGAGAVSQVARPGGSSRPGAPDRLKFIGTPGPDAKERYWPFMVDGAAGKTFTGGLFLRDWGDTAEIGFDVGDKDKSGNPIPYGTSGEPVPYPGGYIYSRAGVSDGRGGLTFVDNEAYARAGASPPFLYIGRPCQLEFPVTEAPSQKGTGGGFTVCVTRNGTVTPIQRSWWSNVGNFVAAGKSTFEAGQTPYPYDVTKLSWWKSGQQQRQKWTAPSGDCNYFDTPGWGNITVIMTDITSAQLDHNAGLAMRCFGSHGEGVDFGHDFSAGRWAAYRVHKDVRTPAISISPATGDIVLGQGPANTHAIHGSLTTPHNPAFQASLAQDAPSVTGDGTAVVVVFDNEGFDRAGNFEPRTGSFTAPVEGLYQLQATVQFGNFGKRDETLIEIVTGDRTHRLSPGALLADRNDRAGACLSVIAAMKAGESAHVRVLVGGGAKTVRLLAGDTVFSGCLIG